MDYLEQARQADLAIAARETIACRQPIPAYDGRDVGPTEAWARHHDFLARAHGSAHAPAREENAIHRHLRVVA